MKSDFAGLVAGALLALSAVAGAQGPSRKSNEQCSLAVVSRLTSSKEKVCDDATVRDLARRGHAFEQNQLGIASMLAIGPDYSEKEARQWFERAAQGGYAPAQVNLAVMYANGWATPVNYGAALHWLQEAANQGFARAYYNLGILFMNGQGVRQNDQEAFRWFEKGAQDNDSYAQTNLGYMYDQGLGCDHDAKAAVNWYRKAANAGNPLGENNLADMYLKGEGVLRDDAEASRWFQRAAEQGSTAARIKLGLMYSEGLGLAKDPETAYMWVLSASLAGDKRGDELLASLQVQLTPEQIAAAREEVRRMSVTQRSQIAQNAFVP